MPFKIGTLQIEDGAVLAPLAGITSSPFRLLAKRLGASLVFSEMISAKGLVYNGRRTKELLSFTAEERPIGLQLFGSDPDILAEAARILQDYSPDLIDLNLGCPTRKIVSNGDGGALLRDPALCRKIFKAVVRASIIPVTVKLRRGWSAAAETAPLIASFAENEGVSAVTIHGRTVEQGYSGQADLDSIAAVRKALSIPVIGNGDVNSLQKALTMLDLTGVKAVMIGRAARGNPWLFRAICEKLNGETLSPSPEAAEVIAFSLEHFKFLARFKGEALAAKEMRRHLPAYLKGFPGASAIRKDLVGISNLAEAEKILFGLISKTAE